MHLVNLDGSPLVSQASDVKSYNNGMVQVNAGYFRGASIDAGNRLHACRKILMCSSVARACMEKITTAVASVPWKVTKANGDEVNPKDPVNFAAKLINRPNRSTTRSQFIQALTIDHMLGRNAFAHKINVQDRINEKGVIPKELWPLLAKDMSIDLNADTTVRQYRRGSKGHAGYKAFPVRDGVSDCLHIKGLSIFEGPLADSMLDAVFPELLTTSNAKEMNANALKNGYSGSGILYGDGVTSEQLTGMANSIENRFSGSKGKRNIGAINSKDVKYLDLSSARPKDMEFIKQLDVNRNSICSVWGVPVQLVDSTVQAIYNNMAEARLIFWEDTVMPMYLDPFADAFTNWLLGDDSDYVLTYDKSKIDALLYKQIKLCEGLEACSFMTINEKRSRAGLESVDDGNDIMIDANKVPLGMGLPLDATLLDDDKEKGSS